MGTRVHLDLAMKAIRSGPRVLAEYIGPAGQRVITEDDLERNSDDSPP
jgi:hypothetical protein